MKTFIITLMLFLFSNLFITPVNAQKLTGGKTESIKNEVETFFREMLVYAEQLDYDKLNSGVDDRYNAGFITNGKYYPQYTSVISDMRENARDVSRQDFSIKEKKISVLSDKIVLMTVAGESAITLSDDRKISVSFHWSFVFEKTGNNWKVIHSHQSRAL